ncbi:phosphatidylserine decarboxylase family protein [Melioribacter sp. Ez-97]|uniref:phosphatidylserine decarboxylase family protein n=1 Tax=Melioribacter sp. Ez-97 TaxID=3423434 RepID=UPI003EDA9CF6
MVYKNLLKNMIAKYGLNTFILMAAISALLILAGIFVNNGWIKYGLIIIGLLFLIFNLNFFRDPERIPPDRNDVVVSPADGEVLFVKEVYEKRFIDDEAIQVSVFMSPLNVHVNRIPIDGKVEYLNYVEGDYLMAFYDKSDLRNERSEIGIRSRYGKVLFTQVAGFIARRIVYELKEGDTVKMGDRFGMIKFGSRSDIIAPKKWTPAVKPGDKVKAGESILFEYKND